MSEADRKIVEVMAQAIAHSGMGDPVNLTRYRDHCAAALAALREEGFEVVERSDITTVRLGTEDFEAFKNAVDGGEP